MTAPDRDGLTEAEREQVDELLRLHVLADDEQAVYDHIGRMVAAARAEERGRAERAEAEAHDAQADYDRRGERLWRLAALAGHEPHESDNDATAELVVTEVLTDAQRAIGVLRRERDALAATVERVRALVAWPVGRPTNGVDRMIPASDLLAALAPAPEQPATEGGAR